MKIKNPAWPLGRLAAWLMLMPLSFLQAQLTVPDVVENRRFNLITFYAPKDYYEDIPALTQQPNEADCSTTSYDVNDVIHGLVAPAVRDFGADFFFRHIKTHGFKRVPICNTNELFYNGDLHNTSTGQCVNFNWVENSPLGFVEAITESAHAENQTIGLYLRDYSDYFFEYQKPTATVIEGLPTEAQQSPCACQFEEEDIPAPLVVTSDGVEVANTPATPTFQSGGGSGNCYAAGDHFLCPNCPAWRQTLRDRILYMANHGTDAFYYDVRHTPWPGCYCNFCSDSYQDFANLTGLPWDNTLSAEDNYLTTNASTHNRRLADYMNFTAMNLFENQYDPNSQDDLNGAMESAGSIGFVSVQDGASLIVDDYRTDFIAAVHIPKMEWDTPLKLLNNRSFWGRDWDDLIEEGNIVDNLSEYFSVLSAYRIPEELRLATSIGIVRDASRFGLSITWQRYDWRRSSGTGPIGNHSLNNNARLRTFLGASYAFGTIGQTTIDNFIQTQVVGTQVQYQFNSRRLWDFSRVATIPNANPSANSIVPIVDLDNLLGPNLANKRSYRYVAIHYSEPERNRYLYMPTGPLALAINGAGSALAAPAGSNAQREALAWYNYLIPMHGAVQALNNFNYRFDVNGDGTPEALTIKMPVTFINDHQLDDAAYLSGHRGIVTPVPVDMETTIIEEGGASAVVLSVPLAPLDGLLQATQDVLNNTNLDIFPVCRGVNWFRVPQDQSQPSQEELMWDLYRRVKETVGYPDMYVTGQGENAQKTMAGFFINQEQTEATIVLSAQPAWGVPHRINGEGTAYDPNHDFEPSTVTAFDGPIMTLNPGDLKVVLPHGSIFANNTPTVRVFYSDVLFDANGEPQAHVESLIPVSFQGGYEIEVPAFQHFVQIVITLQ